MLTIVLLNNAKGINPRYLVFDSSIMIAKYNVIHTNPHID